MVEDHSTYIYTKEVSESANPSTPVTKGTLQMSNMSTPVMKPSMKQQRKIKPLPDSITDMTSLDSHCLVMLEELDPHSKSKTYGKSLHVVSRVKGIGQNNEDIVLDQLTTMQVHLLARNIGTPNLGSKNKIVCHLAIASHFELQQQLSNFGLSPTAWANQTRANVCRAVNVIFSKQFIEDLKKVNDRKSQADHESGNTCKHFWIRAVMAYNNKLDDNVMDDQSTGHTAVAFPEDIKSTIDDAFATLIVSYDDPILAELDTNEEVDLAQFEQMEMNAF